MSQLIPFSPVEVNHVVQSKGEVNLVGKKDMNSICEKIQNNRTSTGLGLKLHLNVSSLTDIQSPKIFRVTGLISPPLTSKKTSLPDISYSTDNFVKPPKNLDFQDESIPVFISPPPQLFRKKFRTFSPFRPETPPIDINSKSKQHCCDRVSPQSRKRLFKSPNVTSYQISCESPELFRRLTYGRERIDEITCADLSLPLMSPEMTTAPLHVDHLEDANPNKLSCLNIETFKRLRSSNNNSLHQQQEKRRKLNGPIRTSPLGYRKAKGTLSMPIFPDSPLAKNRYLEIQPTRGKALWCNSKRTSQEIINHLLRNLDGRRRQA